MEVSIFAYRLLGLLQSGVYLCICYIHMKFLNYTECRCEIASLTSGALSKHEAVFGDCRGEQQIFTDLISLKEKQMECIWRITCLEEDVLVVFPTGFDKRHDSESDEIVSPHWVVILSPLEYTRKQQVENLKNTHCRIESVLSLTWFFFF